MREEHTIHGVQVVVSGSEGQRIKAILRIPPGVHLRPGVVIKLGRGSPLDLGEWTLAGQNFGIVVAIALSIVPLDQLRRLARRRRRTRRQETPRHLAQLTSPSS